MLEARNSNNPILRPIGRSMGWNARLKSACQRHATTRLANSSVFSTRHRRTAFVTTPHCAPLRYADVGLLRYRASHEPKTGPVILGMPVIPSLPDVGGGFSTAIRRRSILKRTKAHAADGRAAVVMAFELPFSASLSAKPCKKQRSCFHRNSLVWHFFAMIWSKRCS